jgi:diguanylate cyclase (GGDEF)-like protein
MSNTRDWNDTTQEQTNERRSSPVSSSKMNRTIRAGGARVGAVARLARTALGVPSGRGLRAERGSAYRSLTVREQSLFRATARRSLRAATILSGITSVVLTPPLAIGTMLLVPERQLLLLAIFGIEGVFGLCITVLALRRWRLPPLPLQFTLAVSITVVLSFLLAFVPELQTPTLMLLANLPSAVALLSPWDAKVQTRWLLASATLLAVFTAVFGRGAVQADEWSGICLVLAISGLMSLAGALGTAGMRRRAFGLQMEARSAHVATLAREVELERLNGALASVTRKDPLTGLGNRRRLDEEVNAAAARATRYDKDCAIALLDLDGFKKYNDSLGHVAGDAALRAVATALVASVRESDTVCRFGGDEFVVVMPEQPLAAAARVAERIRQTVENLQLAYPTPSGPRALTISVGIALLGRSAAHDEDEVLRRADAELYRAKEGGRKLGRDRVGFQHTGRSLVSFPEPSGTLT